MTVLFEPYNMPFTIALFIMLGIAVLEGVTTLLGFGFSNLFGHFLPELELNADTDPGEIGSETSLGKLFGWLNVGRVPIMILLVIFLTVFSLLGYVLQAISLTILGNALPTLLAAPITFFLSFPLVRSLGRRFGRLMPIDETEVISEETFIGRVATITLGTAKKGRPARAKFQDNYGTTHLVMVEPELEKEEFFEGDQVLLTERIGGKFLAVRQTNPLLPK